MKVPFLQSKPKLGLNSAVALMQMILGGAMLCGKTSMLSVSKFLHEVFVLHSIIMASVCLRFGSPASYQQGFNRVSTIVDQEERHKAAVTNSHR